MPNHTVTKADTSKGGAPRVYFDHKHDWKDAYYVSKKIEAPAVGAVIEANTASSDYQGKTYWYLNGWKEANGAATPNATLGKVTPVKGWNIDAGDLSRFASNVIGSAIEAELITDPEQIGVWIAAAYRAGEQLRSGKVQDFNDPLPEFGATGGLNGPVDDGEPSF